jgi:hypothetical protein
MPPLQQLELADCDMSVGSFQQLCQLSSLTSMTLKGLDLYTSNSFERIAADDATDQALVILLRHLPNLAVLSLSLSWPRVNRQVLAAVSGMQRLQRLTLDAQHKAYSNTVSPDLFKLMPDTLTALQLRGGRLPSTASQQLAAAEDGV